MTTATARRRPAGSLGRLAATIGLAACAATAFGSASGAPPTSVSTMAFASVSASMSASMSASISVSAPAEVSSDVRAVTARVPFLLFGADGTLREVMVYAITPDAISIDDGTGTVEEIPIGACLAIVQATDGRLARAAERPSIRRSRGWVRLRSGERLPGVLGTGDVESPDAYPWVHASFGRLELPLDELDSMVFRSTDDPGAIALDEGDRLVLRNGDLIDGFIAEIGSDGILVVRETDDGEQEIRIPAHRAVGLRLVADRAEPQGRRLWLDDGTIIDVSTLSAPPGGGLVLQAPWTGTAELTGIDLEDVGALVLDHRRLVPLSTLEPTRIDPVGPRHRVLPPRPVHADAAAGLGDIDVRGPVALTWEVPPGTTRFTALVEMPRTAQAWGDLTLSVLDGRETVFTTAINRDTPTASIDVPLRSADRRLVIRLDAGRHGPVMDRIRLVLARLLVEPAG